ncbi:hypothetical protein [Shimazuella kribbensis]|uniref:hypothetical protein n=1 Tax=Shimazuella kribbensis TaxID=139808 RepID=UPI0004099C64|nr:hypothetical protein [Shimazuella kribbensis]
MPSHIHKKKIHVHDKDFIYVIHEEPDFVRFRVYPLHSKTSYGDLYFTWKDNWLINFYKPSIAARLIDYVIKSGWDYQKEKQRYEHKEASFLIKELGLELLGNNDS